VLKFYLNFEFTAIGADTVQVQIVLLKVLFLIYYKSRAHCLLDVGKHIRHLIVVTDIDGQVSQWWPDNCD
jgi:hypothetical protein